MKPNLFQSKDFQLASGQKSNWKIECDALTDADWQTIASLIIHRYKFSEVTGIPTGGLKLASLLRPHVVSGVVNSLIVDDVYTTGQSMHRIRDELVLRPDGGSKRYLGVVVFARSRIFGSSLWITPIFGWGLY